MTARQDPPQGVTEDDVQEQIRLELAKQTTITEGLFPELFG
jgi:hypothetical protein